MNKKKLAVFIISLRGGGAERVASILLDQLSTDYEMSLVLLSPDITYKIPESLKVHYLDNQQVKESAFNRIFKLPLLAWSFYKYCKKEKIDMVLSFMYRPNFINVLAGMLGSSHKVYASERSNPSKKNRLFKLLVKLLYPKADLVLPNSQGTAIILDKQFSVSRNVKVIPNPINLEHIESTSSVKKNNSNFVFVTLGRLNPLKDHQLLIRAFGELNLPNTELWVVGKGDLEIELKSLADQYENGDCIKFMGFSSDPFQYLKSSDCFVFASKFEGFPNVLVEAMASGLPVISTDCESGPREIMAPESNLESKISKGVEKTKYGYLVPIGSLESFKDAMTLIYDQKRELSKLSEASLCRSKDYEQSKIVEMFKEVLN